MIEQQKRKKSRKRYTYYKIEEDKLVRLLKKCPRCNVFMAHHEGDKARWACGKCSYTEYTSK